MSASFILYVLKLKFKFRLYPDVEYTLTVRPTLPPPPPPPPEGCGGLVVLPFPNVKESKPPAASTLVHRVKESKPPAASILVHRVKESKPAAASTLVHRVKEIKPPVASILVHRVKESNHRQPAPWSTAHCSVAMQLFCTTAAASQPASQGPQQMQRVVDTSW